jgi:hypothetical protein
MLGFLLRGALRMLALAGALYFAFFVSLGERTLYGHLSRIATTAEAKELGTALSASARKMMDTVRSTVSGLPAGNPADP